MTRDSTVTINNSALSSNDAGHAGGGLFIVGGTAKLQESVVADNRALDENGGGVYHSGVDLVVLKSQLVGNTADFRGGAVFSLGELTISKSTLSANAAGDQGGGLYTNSGDGKIASSTISGNTAGSAGEALYVNKDSLTLVNTTIFAESASGMTVGTNGTVKLRNTIVDTSSNCGGSGTLRSLGHNLSSDATCLSDFTEPGDLNNVDPLLGPLDDNGGPTLTHALLAGSPAIDAGIDVALPDTDQRDFPRAVDGDGDAVAALDIGAFEFVPPDVLMHQATADGFSTMELTYEVAQDPGTSFEVGVYRSADATFDGQGDELLDLIVIDNPSDLELGIHTIFLPIGEGSGEVALPGAGAEETDSEYHLLFVTDTAAAFSGVYHPAGGSVFVHGTAEDDSIGIGTGDLELDFNGSLFNYDPNDTADVRIRVHAGDDEVFGGASTAVIRAWGGSGQDSLQGGDRDSLDGGADADSITLTGVGFKQVAGGSAEDTLRLDASGLHLDLTSIRDESTRGIERIDITGTDRNSLTLNVLEVLNLSDASNTLVVLGNSDDHVDFGPGWTRTGSEVIDGSSFAVYAQGAATLKIASAVSISDPAAFELSSLFPANGGDGTSGFVFQGGDAGDRAGWSVSGAGDLNGDGFDDVVIGASRADPNGKAGAGESYVVFGKAEGFPPVLDPSLLDGTNGFALAGIDPFDFSGRAVSSAGDVNGDGFDDLFLGAPGGDLGAPEQYPANQGESYVVFGKSGSFAPVMELSLLDGTDGFTVKGIVNGDVVGSWLSSAGDMNGDGFNDLAIGSEYPFDYVVFGKAGGFDAVVDLASVDGTNGFQLIGSNDDIAFSINSAGDINGDGFDDVILGAGPYRRRAGISYVVFGKRAGFPPSLRLSLLDGTDGFAINGETAGFGISWSVSGAGDINGDGFDDLLVGAPQDSPDGKSDAGVSYVIYGKLGGFAASLDVASLDGTNGFAIKGVDPHDRSGGSVSAAGDVNGDGFDDVIIGAYAADPNGNRDAGESYVVYGRPDGFPAELELSELGNSPNGFVVHGVSAGDYSGISVSGAGDVNGDGFDDLIIGTFLPDPNGLSEAGESYVLFGGDFSAAVTHRGAAGDNVLVGDSEANVMIGGTGADTLVGAGGADVLRGGEGDDVLAVADAAFARIVGGNGVDTLRFDGFGVKLDLRAVPDNRITGIEQVSMLGSGPNTLSVNVLEVLNLSDESNTLTVFGEGDDTVQLTPDWALTSTELVGGTLMNVFTQGAAVLKVPSVMQTALISNDLTVEAEFFVNSTRDAPDSDTADGVCDTGVVLPDGAPECTLRAAVMQANARSGQTTVHLPEGTYTLTIAGADEAAAATGDLDIRTQLALVGAGSETTLIDGNALDRIFDIKGTVEISGVTIQNGSTTDGGGIRVPYGSLTLDDVVVTNSVATGRGGGIVVFDTRVSGPTGYVPATSLFLTNSTVSHNTAGGSGGGILGDAVSLAGSTVSDNQSAEDGGGVYASRAIVTDSTLTGNSARDGGGLYAGAGGTVTRSTIAANTSSRNGGGILQRGTLEVTDSMIVDNTAVENGGGIYSDFGATIVTGSTISGNVAVERAGGGIAKAGTLTISNSTVSANSAGTWGGGINASGAISITNATLADNFSDTGGSGLDGSSFTVLNTILANDGQDCSVSGSTSLGHNLSTDNTCSFFSSSLGDLNNTDPLLGPLADNGGPTLTHALLPGSPAIDAGDNTGAPALDQRGVARPQDGDGDGIAVVDIGAFESQETAPEIVAGVLKAAADWLGTRPDGATSTVAGPNVVKTDGAGNPGIESAASVPSRVRSPRAAPFREATINDVADEPATQPLVARETVPAAATPSATPKPLPLPTRREQLIDLALTAFDEDELIFLDFDPMLLR